MCFVSTLSANSLEFWRYSSMQWTGDDLRSSCNSWISWNSSAKNCRPDLALRATSLLSGFSDPWRIPRDFSKAGIDFIKFALTPSRLSTKMGLLLEKDRCNTFCAVLCTNCDFNFKFASLAISSWTDLFPDMWLFWWWWCGFTVKFRRIVYSCCWLNKRRLHRSYLGNFKNSALGQFGEIFLRRDGGLLISTKNFAKSHGTSEILGGQGPNTGDKSSKNFVVGLSLFSRPPYCRGMAYVC